MHHSGNSHHPSLTILSREICCVCIAYYCSIVRPGKLTCTAVLQVNLDFESEADMVEKMRIGIALQPVATALFANSPFRDGSDTGMPTFMTDFIFPSGQHHSGY